MPPLLLVDEGSLIEGSGAVYLWNDLALLDPLLLDADLRADLAVLVDGVEGTLHELATLEQVVDVISEHILAVNVALDLEQELAARHSVRDLDARPALVQKASVGKPDSPLVVALMRLVLSSLRIFHRGSRLVLRPSLLKQALLEVKAKHERLLLEALVVLVLEVRDVHVLLLRSVLDRKRHLPKLLQAQEVVAGVEEVLNERIWYFSFILRLGSLVELLVHGLAREALGCESVCKDELIEAVCLLVGHSQVAVIVRNERLSLRKRKHKNKFNQ